MKTDLHFEPTQPEARQLAFSFLSPIPGPVELSRDGEILPIVNSAELYREGAAMRHCVGRYANEIKHGKIYVYSVRRDGKRLATLALGRVEGRASLIQIRGPCNAHPPKEIVSTVRRWLRAQTPLTPQMPPPLDDPW
jgi:PcfJ-like protein